MANDWLFPFMSLAMLRKNERARATEPMMLTMIPGPAAQRTALGALAVTDQARAGLRRERRVAEQTIEVVTTAFDDPDKVTLEILQARPALRPIATPALTDTIKQAAKAMKDGGDPGIASGAAGGNGQVLSDKSKDGFGAAVNLVEALLKGTKLTAKQAKDFAPFIDMLSEEEKAKLV